METGDRKRASSSFQHNLHSHTRHHQVRVGIRHLVRGQLPEPVRPGPQGQKALVGVSDGNRARLENVLKQELQERQLTQNELGFRAAAVEHSENGAYLKIYHFKDYRDMNVEPIRISIRSMTINEKTDN